MFLNFRAEKLDPLERAEIKKILPPLDEKTVLDLGAGIGRFTKLFAPSAKKVVAVDLCSHFIEEGKKSTSSFTNIEWISRDVMEVDFAPQSFDLIFISWVLMYLEIDEVKKLIIKLQKWLKPE